MDYRYFAFIDVLGYRAHLDSDKKTGKTDFLNRLKRSFASLDNIDTSKFQIRSVSDSIFVFATGDKENDFIGLLETVKDLFTSFLANSLFLRGGIAWDQHFQTDRITYSLALVQAYELESKEAIVPRIVIADQILEKAKNEGWAEKLISKNLVILDGNRLQLHILTEENWDSVYKNAKTISLEINQNNKIPSDVRLKHLWFEDYLFAHKPKKNRSQRYLKRWGSLASQ